MLRPRPLAAACLAAITLVPSSEGWAADLAAQRLIARAAIDILPHPLAVLLNDRLEEFEERVLEPQTAWPQDRRMRDRRLWNRVALDIAAQQPSPEARLVAARQFPTEKAEALRLYRRLSRRGGNGTLPWAVEQLQHELIEAFRQGNADDLVRQAGYLTHYAAQCCSPFHVSTNFDGKETGNLRLQPVALAIPTTPTGTYPPASSGSWFGETRAGTPTGCTSRPVTRTRWSSRCSGPGRSCSPRWRPWTRLRRPTPRSCC